MYRSSIDCCKVVLVCMRVFLSAHGLACREALVLRHQSDCVKIILADKCSFGNRSSDSTTKDTHTWHQIRFRVAAPLLN